LKSVLREQNISHIYEFIKGQHLHTCSNPAKHVQYAFSIAPLFLWMHTHSLCGIWLMRWDGVQLVFSKQTLLSSDTLWYSTSFIQDSLEAK